MGMAREGSFLVEAIAAAGWPSNAKSSNQPTDGGYVVRGVLVGLLMIVTELALAGGSSSERRTMTEVEGLSYVFMIPTNVTFEQWGSDDRYSFCLCPGSRSDFFRLSVQDVPTYALLETQTTALVTQFQQMMLRDPRVTKVKKKEQQVELGAFLGKEACVSSYSNDVRVLRTYILALWDGQRGWRGQLSTSSTNDAIYQAYEILRDAHATDAKAHVPSVQPEDSP